MGNGVCRAGAVSLFLLGGWAGGVEQIAAQDTIEGIRIREYGPPEVLRIESLPRPQPGDGELLVRVHAAGVNPSDTNVRSGRGGGYTGAQLPYVPGFDVSGVVAAVGPGVTDFDVGDEVFAMLALTRGGGYAEYTIVRSDEAALKPPSLSHVEAAALPLVGLTAWQALFDTADLEAGQTVLIHAAAGGVGSIAVQLAKWRGARVIATASPRNHAFLQELGADVVVDYNTQRFEDFAREVDVVLDPIAGETQVRSLEVLREGGILVSLLGLTPQARSPTRSVRAVSILVQSNGEQLGRLGALVEDGRVQSIVSHVFPLADAPLAHAQSETRETRGKIVLQVVDP